ncbi:hypothetical protein EON80_27785, partial [bacterium]
MKSSDEKTPWKASTRQQLRQHIAAIIAQETGETIDPIITRANSPFGEFTSNTPLQTAALLRQTPQQIGHTLTTQLAAHFPGR